MHWFCVYTKPQREAQLAGYLRQTLGLETYLPRFQEHRTIRRKRQLVTGPLFPRYLFCRFDLGESYRAVRYAPEALDVVHSGARPAVVDAGLITALKAWAGDGTEIIRLQCDLSVGEVVEVTDGPMRGLTATILQVDDARDRVALLLTILQGAQLTVSREQIKRVA